MNRLTKLSKVMLFGVVLCQVTQAQELTANEDWPNHQVYQLLAERGTYILDFDKIYETTASLDVETAVTLPLGYTFSLSRSGSSDFINAFVMQNTLFYTRTIDHAFSTSIICNVITPAGETKPLIFKVRGGVKEPVVYAIHFKILREDVVEPQIEEKSCAPEIEAALLIKERDLTGIVYENTMIEATPAFFGTHRGSMKKKYKGATVFINGVIFTRGDAYIYLYSDVKRDNCDVVKLLGISQGPKKSRAELPADLVTTFENFDGTWMYVYKAALQQPPKNKRVKTIFVFEIWSKKLTYNTIIS